MTKTRLPGYPRHHRRCQSACFAVIDFPPRNEPRMHRTETIDHVIVLEGGHGHGHGHGRLDGEDEGRRHDGPARHQPRLGQSQHRARVTFVLIDAAPLGIGHPITGAANAR